MKGSWHLVETDSPPRTRRWSKRISDHDSEIEEEEELTERLKGLAGWIDERVLAALVPAAALGYLSLPLGKGGNRGREVNTKMGGRCFLGR